MDRQEADRSASPRIRVGDVFDGKWRIESKLGAGGMGSVFLAHDIALDRKVAIKVLAQELSRDQQYVERFEQEARLTAKLEHPNVVPVYAVGRFKGRPFMVMKKLEGETLAGRLQMGKMTVSETLELTRQLCAGLAHIHAHGCVHRDIKAGNIFIGEDGHATILDFGVLRDRSTRVNTLAGMLLGTPNYMSPEQASGALDIDHRADLYALGVVLFECLTGISPFVGETTLAVIQMHANAVPPVITDVDPSLPEALGPMLACVLEKDPDARVQSAEEFLAAFEAAILSQPPNSQVFDPISDPFDRAPLPPPDIETRSEILGWMREKAIWLAIGSVVLLGGVGAFYAALHRHTPATDLLLEEPKPLPLPQPSQASQDSRKYPTQFPVAQRIGTLRVTSVLSGRPYTATVLVDGVERGETPISIDLPVGKHLLRAERTGFQPFESEVVINSRQITAVKVDLLP